MRKIDRHFFIVVGLILMSILVVWRVSNLFDNSELAAKKYNWQAILNDSKRSYGILCNGVTYALTLDPPDTENNMSGFFIGSSTQDLNQYCDKKVTVKAIGRERLDKPLCTENAKQKNDPACNEKLPVVDILEIEAIQ